ncbi:MAG: hypothetical protein ABEJ79_03985 [Halolamina sp.]
MGPGPPPAAAVDHADEVVSGVRRRLRTERRRTTDEYEALGAFAERVRALDPEPGRPTTPGVVSARRQRRSGSALTTVRDAYRATVMSVPHYDEEYGDPYERSLAAEFGPEVAIALTEGSAFDRRCEAALLEAIGQARAEREGWIDVLDEEAESVDRVAGDLRAVADGVASLSDVADDPDGPDDAGVRDAYARRLDVLVDRADRAVESRLETVRRHRRAAAGPDAFTPQAFLYRPFDDRHPLLSLAATLRRCADGVRAALSLPGESESTAPVDT